MSFTSVDFFILLAVVTILYWLSPLAFLRKTLLIASSLLFYGYVQPLLCLLLVFAAASGWAGALLINRLPRQRKSGLIFGITMLLGLLIFFKYAGFIADSVALAFDISSLTYTLNHFEILIQKVYIFFGLTAGGSYILPPLGISFYTFQCLGYLIDVYRGKSKAERNPWDVLLFISFFPQLVAGPIERAHHLLPQLKQRHSLKLTYFASAIPLLLRGLIKKMAIADNLAPFVDQVYAQSEPSTLLLYFATLAFAVQIFCDFSGYTDIARGAARLLGINLMENFNAPYLALTPADFWRRWHISFSLWIRDYLYIPLGGSRAGGVFALFTILVLTFGLSGLWHGAAWHFVIWGVYHAILVFACHLLKMHNRNWRPASWASTFFCWLGMFNLTLLGWVLFRAPSLSWLKNILLRLPFELNAHALFSESGEALRLGAAVAFYALPFAGFYFLKNLRPPILRGFAYGILFCWLVIFASGTDYDFIYFRF